MTAIPVILAGALALGVQAPPQSQQQPPPDPKTKAPSAPRADQDQAVILTGCVVPSPEIEDTFQLVPAEPERGRPVGTTGTSPAWTVPLYLLVGGSITAEHLNKTVEVTGTIQPPGAPVVVAAAPAARLQVQAAKVVAATCTPRKAGTQAR